MTTHYHESDNILQNIIFGEMSALGALRDKYLQLELRREKNLDARINLLERYQRFDDTANFPGNEECRVEIVEAELARETWDLTDPLHAKFLFSLSFFVPNEFQRNQLQERTLDRLLQGPFEEGYAILFNHDTYKKIRSLAPVLRFIEQTAITHEQFDMLKHKLDEILSYKEDIPQLAKLAIFEQLHNCISSPKSSVDLLSTLLETSENDKALKLILYRAKGNSDYVEPTMRILYQLPSSVRYALLRNVFSSEQGILASQRGRNHLYETLLDTLLKDPRSETDREWYDQLAAVSNKFILSGEIEHVYFVLVPLLIDKILNPPKRSTPISEVVEDYIFEKLDRHIYSDEEREFHRKALHGEDVRREAEVFFKRNYSSEDTKVILKEFFDVQQSIRETLDEHLENSEFEVDEEDIKEALPGYVPRLNEITEAKKQKRREKISVLEFIVETSKALGAPGVRFLQLLGQYVPIPPKYQREFNSVYDGMQGQSKLAAYMLLEREWEGFKVEVAEFRPTVGGGSLMTVYETLMSNGRREVVKVLNPNAEFHTEHSFSVIKHLIELLIQDNEDYATALPLLEDIREWIVQDIKFEHFLEKDKVFYEQNNGFSTGGCYSIKVPISKGIENRFYKREEFIEGVNLTEIRSLKRSGHDLKAIVSLIANNYIQQITQGKCHADIHPGNFRITKQREVAILDRNFYLELDQMDQMFLYSMGNSVDTKDKAQTITSYCTHRNQELPDNFTDALIQVMEKEVGMNQLSSAMRYIRLQKIQVPLKMSLMVKNLYALNSMACTVGFSGIEEAVQYKG